MILSWSSSSTFTWLFILNRLRHHCTAVMWWEKASEYFLFGGSLTLTVHLLCMWAIAASIRDAVQWSLCCYRLGCAKNKRSNCGCVHSWWSDECCSISASKNSPTSLDVRVCAWPSDSKSISTITGVLSHLSWDPADQHVHKDEFVTIRCFHNDCGSVLCATSTRWQLPGE